MWKLKDLRELTKPRIMTRESLPTPPRGMEWEQDETTLQWRLIPDGGGGEVSSERPPHKINAMMPSSSTTIAAAAAAAAATRNLIAAASVKPAASNKRRRFLHFLGLLIPTVALIVKSTAHLLHFRESGLLLLNERKEQFGGDRLRAGSMEAT